MSDPPVITFLSDYGLADGFAGVCHGVIETVCPSARVIDITHGVPPGDIRAGGLILRAALPYTPVGVHLAVVDPGVGGPRGAVAVRVGDGRVLVGPDNGLLWLAAQESGGAVEAVEIGRSRFRIEPVSATFHGRDIFAPVAARLAAGVALEAAGEPYEPERLVALELPTPRFNDGVLVAHAVYIDHFGNVQLDAGAEHADRAGLKLGQGAVVGGHRARYGCAFGDVAPGDLLLYEDSGRMLSIAVNRGNAAERLGLAVDDELHIEPS
ncbi:MAG TPA: SAM-dependent chlorinase/fluorinase [Solirubrobacteraceae bacterium]